MTNKTSIITLFAIAVLMFAAVSGVVLLNTSAEQNEQKMATITFDMDGAEGTQVSPITVPLYTAVKTPVVDWEKDGYMLGGWIGFGASFNNGYFIPFKEVVVIKASWLKADTITYDFNDGKGISIKDVQLQKTTLIIKKCPVEKEGFKFNCWMDKSNGQFYYPDREVKLPEYQHGKLNLIAIWLPN